MSRLAERHKLTNHTNRKKNRTQKKRTLEPNAATLSKSIHIKINLMKKNKKKSVHL